MAVRKINLTIFEIYIHILIEYIFSKENSCSNMFFYERIVVIIEANQQRAIKQAFK